MVGNYPQQITKDITFLVVDCLSASNAIFGRPTLNSWKAVTSTYHLIIKFLTDYKVGELRRNQVAARKCYIAMMEMDNHLQAMNMEVIPSMEHKTPPKVLPVEDGTKSDTPHFRFISFN